MRYELEILKGKIYFFSKENIPFKLQKHHLKYIALNIIEIRKKSSIPFDKEESELLCWANGYIKFWKEIDN